MEDVMTTHAAAINSLSIGLNARYIAELRQALVRNVPRHYLIDPLTGRDGMCALAAEVSARILRRRGCEVDLQLVDGTFVNESAMRCLRAHNKVGPEHDAEFPGHWSVGTWPTGSHLVAIINGSTLLDAASFQFHRAERGLVVPMPLVATWDGQCGAVELDLGGCAVYRSAGEGGSLYRDRVDPLLQSRPLRKFVEAWARRTSAP